MARRDTSWSLTKRPIPWSWSRPSEILRRRLRIRSCAGANVIEAIVGDASPVAAVQDALLRRDYDTIVISTLPPKASRWLRMDVIHRLERVVTVPVIHVIAHSHG